MIAVGTRGGHSHRYAAEGIDLEAEDAQPDDGDGGFAWADGTATDFTRDVAE